MKQIQSICIGIVLIISGTYMHAHDSYLTRSLDHVASSPLFDQSEKELIAALPEFFTHAYVNQLYFGDTEQRALKPFIETVSTKVELLKPIKDKLTLLQTQTAVRDEKDMVDLVRHLLDLLLEYVRTDCAAPTRASAADVAEACRELILINLEITKNINNNVNNIIGNIQAPCT